MIKEHVVVVGFDEIVSNKYLICIKEAIDRGYIDGYSIIDLESSKAEIVKRIDESICLPEKIYFLDDINQKNGYDWSYENEFSKVFEDIMDSKSNIKVYIATEVKAHQAYIEYCVKNNIPTLTEKPVLAPLINNEYAPEAIDSIMDNINSHIQKTKKYHSVMTLSRYHKIYNDKFIDVIKEKMIKYKAPVTSVHLRHAGGVWNTHDEYESRNDHPYKFGYGMIMHGGYHYIDLVVQLLMLNKLIYPNTQFELRMSSYVAYPYDQNTRISKKISKIFDDNKENWATEKEQESTFGETDVTSTFSLINKDNGRVITLGTIALEQTTPSVRKWKKIPKGIYNKNGRTSSVDVEAQLATLYSKTVKCYDVPIRGVKEVERIDATAKILTRANASLLKEENYIESESYSGLFHSNSNKALMTNWLEGSEIRSTFSDHIPVMKFVQALSESIKNPGNQICIDFV